MDKVMYFRYTGIQYGSHKDGFLIDGNQVGTDLRVSNKEVLDSQEDGKLCPEVLSIFKSFIWQLTALNNLVRLDIIYVIKQLDTKKINATKSDMRNLRALNK